MFKNDQISKCSSALDFGRLRTSASTALEYRHTKKDNILTIGDVENIIEKCSTDEEHIRYFCHNDELYAIIHKSHMDT